jgi:hypothetical protein
MEVISALAGAIVGGIIGFISSQITTARENKSRSKSARTLLRLEIDTNLQMLRDLWAKLRQTDTPSKISESDKVKLIQKFIEMPFQPFTRVAFESQLNLLTSALNEQGITQVYQFYSQLSQVERIREDLIILQDMERQEAGAAASRAIANRAIAPGVGYRFPKPFINSAPDTWDECEKLITQLLTKGNPLA